MWEPELAEDRVTHATSNDMKDMDGKNCGIATGCYLAPAPGSGQIDLFFVSLDVNIGPIYKVGRICLPVVKNGELEL